MDNKNRKINKTVTQAITDKYTKFKTEEKEAILKSFRCEKDEEYWAENIRQFILVEVKTSEEYTQEEIDYVQKSLKEAKEAGHSNTANSKGGEEEHSAAASNGGEEEHSAAASDGGDAGHSNTANSKGGEEEHSAAASDGGEAGHSNTANSEGWEEGHGYSVSETNVINCLKSLKGVKHGDDMKDEQLRRRQARNVRQKYENTYSY